MGVSFACWRKATHLVSVCPCVALASVPWAWLQFGVVRYCYLQWRKECTLHDWRTQLAAEALLHICNSVRILSEYTSEFHELIQLIGQINLSVIYLFAQIDEHDELMTDLSRSLNGKILLQIGQHCLTTVNAVIAVILSSWRTVVFDRSAVTARISAVVLTIH